MNRTPDSDDGRRVSVVVPTRNSVEFLEPCLQSIRSQSHQNLELIVVDNSSSDDTWQIARRYTDHVLVAGPERSAQRNHGARHARGDYVLFVDSDMVLDVDVIESCVRQMQSNPACACIVIPEISVGDGFWARCKALERSCYVGDDSIEAARFFSRSVFETIGGFDESLNGPEDWDLSRRAAEVGAVSRVSVSIRHMEGHLTLPETMRAKFYYGKTMGRYIRKHSVRGVRSQLVPVRAAYLRHWRRLLRDPLHLGGFILMKSCEIVAGAAGTVLGLRRDTTAQWVESTS